MADSVTSKKPLRIALVGCGFMGKMHANVYSSLPHADLVTVVDPDPERASKFASEFKVSQYPTLAEAAASEVIDIVDICLPTDLHMKTTVEAAKLGKHVFCEKPMALSLEEADEMIRETKAAGVQLFIGHCIRFWPEYVYLKEVVDSNSLGELLSINLTRYGAFPKWTAQNWSSKPGRAGGGVLDMHIHDTDFAHYLLGKPDSVTSFGTVDERGPSHAFTTLTYGKKIAHLEGGWNLPSNAPFKMAFRAIFENGAIIWDGSPLTVYEEGKPAFQPEFKKMAAEGGGNISDLGGYYHELEYATRCILNGAPIETVTPESSRQSLATVLEEINQIFSHQNQS